MSRGNRPERRRKSKEDRTILGAVKRDANVRIGHAHKIAEVRARENTVLATAVAILLHRAKESEITITHDEIGAIVAEVELIPQPDGITVRSTRLSPVNLPDEPEAST